MLAKDRTIPRSEKEDYYVQHIRQHTLCVQVICAPTSLGELMCSGPGKHYTSRGVPSQRRDPELRNPQSIIRELQPLPNIISIVLRNELQRDILLHSSKVVLLQTSLKRLSGGVWVRGVMLAWQAEMWEIHGGQFPNKQFLSILFFLSLLNLPCNFFFFFFLATLHGKLTRDPPCAAGLEVPSLNHWTTREVPKPFLFVFLIVSSLFAFKIWFDPPEVFFSNRYL